jgi:hypothetical protein
LAPGNGSFFQSIRIKKKIFSWPLLTSGFIRLKFYNLKSHVRLGTVSELGLHKYYTIIIDISGMFYKVQYSLFLESVSFLDFINPFLLIFFLPFRSFLIALVLRN